MNIDRQIVIIGLCVLGVFLILFIVIKLLAESYINTHREEIAEQSPSVDKCKETAVKLLNNTSTFWQYIDELHLSRVYKCSSSVVAGATTNPIKYLIKYANIENNITTLQMIDFCIMYFQLFDQYMNYISSVRKEATERLPSWVSIGANTDNLPYKICKIDKNRVKLTLPFFRFYYISPAGQSGRSHTITINSEILTQIRNSLNSKIQKSGFSKSQRSAMSNDLREAIKRRDNYTCCICGNSVLKEPNLLLEVDHIIPIAKGGRTEASNLQTLCWRCNREKRDKLL